MAYRLGGDIGKKARGTQFASDARQTEVKEPRRTVGAHKQSRGSAGVTAKGALFAFLCACGGFVAPKCTRHTTGLALFRLGLPRFAILTLRTGIRNREAADNTLDTRALPWLVLELSRQAINT